MAGLGGIGEEISQVLFSTFNSHQGDGFSKSEISRMWSLEMQWFAPESSPILVDTLHSRGWLVGSTDSLRPAPGLDLEPPPLGWQPLLVRTGDVPAAPVSDVQQGRPTEPAKAASETTPLSSTPAEGGADRTQTLISLVSRKSGLERREVVRRAQRKRRALGPITLDFAVALLAREQSLDMHEVLEIIGN